MNELMNVFWFDDEGAAGGTPVAPPAASPAGTPTVPSNDSPATDNSPTTPSSTPSVPDSPSSGEIFKLYIYI